MAKIMKQSPQIWEIRDTSHINRREFLKFGCLSLASLSFRELKADTFLQEFPQSEKLGRVAVGMVELKLRPDLESQTLGVLYEDAVVPWLREISGVKPAYIFNNQRWVETPDGYIYGPYLQPVFQRPNQPVSELPVSSLGRVCGRK